MMNMAQRHRARRVQAVAGGQPSDGRRQGDDAAALLDQDVQGLPDPLVLQAARAERHDASTAPGLGEKPERRLRLRPAVAGLGHHHECQVLGRVQLLRNGLGEVRDRRAPRGRQSAPDGRAAGARRADEDDGSGGPRHGGCIDRPARVDHAPVTPPLRSPPRGPRAAPRNRGRRHERGGRRRRGEPCGSPRRGPSCPSA